MSDKVSILVISKNTPAAVEQQINAYLESGAELIQIVARGAVLWAFFTRPTKLAIKKRVDGVLTTELQ